jgi:hypothetical protein
LSLRSWALWLLGYPEAALRDTDEGTQLEVLAQTKPVPMIFEDAASTLVGSIQCVKRQPLIELRSSFCEVSSVKCGSTREIMPKHFGKRGTYADMLSLPNDGRYPAQAKLVKCVF